MKKDMERKDIQWKGFGKENVFTITHYKKTLSHIVRTTNKNGMDKNGLKWTKMD